MTGPKTSLPVEIVFVCTGNICRSPMAEVIAKAKAEEAGLEDNVIFSSCGMGNWHVGQPADKRALAELKSAGYNGDTHRAAQLGPEHMRADLFVALDSGHAGELAATGVPCVPSTQSPTPPTMSQTLTTAHPRISCSPVKTSKMLCRAFWSGSEITSALILRSLS